MQYSFRYLTQDDVVKAGGLDMSAAIQDMEEVLSQLANDQCILPTKVTLRFGNVETEKTLGFINAMPGYVGGDYDTAGLKWVSVMPQNPTARGLPSTVAVLVLSDPHTGFPTAVMDGTLIYPMRTGGVSGVVAKRMARRDSRLVGLVGTGAQARAQLMALDAALPGLERALVFDKDRDKALSFCQTLETDLGMALEVATTVEEAVQDADVLVSTQPQDTPVIRKGAIPKGLLHLQIGGAVCEHAAIPEFDKIVTDNWSEIQHRGVITLARLKAAGLITDDDIYADLGDIVVGKKPGRESDDESIYFGQVGMGVEDIAVAGRIFRQAERDDIGVVIPLWERPAFV